MHFPNTAAIAGWALNWGREGAVRATKGMQMVAEGVLPRPQGSFRRFDVDMPITEQVHQILVNGKDPRTAVMT